MSEIISCPSCQRKVQVPEVLAGQDVQCPTCGATFVAKLPGASKATPERWETGVDRPPSWKEPLPQGGHEDYRDYGRPGDYDRAFDPYRRDLMPHRGTTILVFGLLGVVLCPFFAPAAWIMGNADMTEIRAGRMNPDGEGLTQAGRIIGIIGTALGLLWMCSMGLVLLSLGGH